MGSVDIILASCNGSEYIGELIGSILDSSFTDFKIFICDDRSTDDTPAIAADFVNRYPDRIRFSVNEERLGSTLNFLNNLKRIAKEEPADYYMFCDQDDVWLTDKIGLSVKSISKIENSRGKDHPALVFCDAIVVDKDLEYISHSFYRTNGLKTHRNVFQRLLIENRCIGCTTIMNSALVSLLDETGPAIRYHDWWMALIASAFGTVRFNKTPVILYRQHGSNQVGQKRFSAYAKERAAQKEDTRSRLKMTYAQAEYFESIYGDRLSKNKRRALESFVHLKDSGFFARRFSIIRNRFFKSGFVRNIGLLFYV